MVTLHTFRETVLIRLHVFRRYVAIRNIGSVMLQLSRMDFKFSFMLVHIRSKLNMSDEIM